MTLKDEYTETLQHEEGDLKLPVFRFLHDEDAKYKHDPSSQEKNIVLQGSLSRLRQSCVQGLIDLVVFLTNP